MHKPELRLISQWSLYCAEYKARKVINVNESKLFSSVWLFTTGWHLQRKKHYSPLSWEVCLHFPWLSRLPYKTWLQKYSTKRGVNLRKNLKNLECQLNYIKCYIVVIYMIRGLSVTSHRVHCYTSIQQWIQIKNYNIFKHTLQL